MEFEEAITGSLFTAPVLPCMWSFLIHVKNTFPPDLAFKDHEYWMYYKDVKYLMQPLISLWVVVGKHAVVWEGALLVRVKHMACIKLYAM